MMRSMFSGVSGLRIHQTKMDVLAHNIANVNTVGFKSSRVTFSEIFSQTIQGASAANPTTGRGGVNPQQIGLGARLGSIDKIMTPGAYQRTDYPLDLMIEGEGFFVVHDANGYYFTRAGNFNVDKEGFLVMQGNGLTVMGWMSQWDDISKTYVIQEKQVAPIEVGGINYSIPPKVTTQIDFMRNLNSQTTPPEGIARTVSFYDSVGNLYELDAYFRYLGDTGVIADHSEWEVSFGKPNVTVDTSTSPPTVTCTYDDPILYIAGSRTEIALTPGSLPEFSIFFDTNGQIRAVDAILGNMLKNIDIDVDPADRPLLDPLATFGNGTSPGTGSLDLNFREITQFGREQSNVMSEAADGNSAGTQIGLNVGPDGKIIGLYSNGMTKLIGQIPLAFFRNPSGLEKVGNNLFRPTPNSGAFNGVGEAGIIQGGVLEMSNVDLANEFVEMITAQRGFQANSRIISTSDEMLMELVNLKR